LKTVNSISGGKTSSYLAAHYPADYDVFALVRIEDIKCAPKDPGLIKAVSDKIGMDFIATAESDITLKAVLDLEQLIGRQITWVAGWTFEEVVRKRKALPNQAWRFCTTEMKMKPIFDFCHNVIGDVVKMRIGFRYDEKERANNSNTHFKTVIGQHPDGRNKWDEIYWRECEYPLIDDKIGHYTVYKWAQSSGLGFPKDSNCVGCFWKPIQQLRKNWDDEPEKMQWFADQETPKRKWKKEMTYNKIKRVGLQSSFEFGTGAGCQAGFCTD
jgi:hypothetical protein